MLQTWARFRYRGRPQTQHKEAFRFGELAAFMLPARSVFSVNLNTPITKKFIGRLGIATDLYAGVRKTFEGVCGALNCRVN
jgi:hypothetical protein